MRLRLPLPLLSPILGAMLPLCGAATAQTAPSPQDQLAQIKSVNKLDDATMAPWHLKMDVQLYDSVGKPKEKGTIEEWWSGPKSYRIAYATPSYTAVQLRTSDGFFATPGMVDAPYFLDYLREQVIDPMADLPDPADAELESVMKTFGSVKLACVMVRRKASKGASTGDIPPQSFCTLPGKDDVLVSESISSVVTSRPKTGTFRGRAVALDLTVQLGERPVVSGKVAQLQGQAAPYTSMLSSSGLEKQEQTVILGSAVKPGKIINKVQPVYPTMAKARHLTGAVLLAGLIDSSGKVKSLEVLSSPAQDLTDAAMDAVRHWTYQPYLADGEPVAVRTVITVNFNLGRM